MRLLTRVPLTLLLSIVFLNNRCFGGGGPAGFIVVYNPNDANSVTVANYYEQVRHIPERNMIPYPFPQTFDRNSAWTFVQTLRGDIASRGLSNQFQGIALAGMVPEASWYTGNVGNQDSLQSFLYKSPNYGQASYPYNDADNNNAFAASTVMGPLASQVPLMPNVNFNGQNYWPVSYVGYTGKGGITFSEALAYIDRAKSHDGTNASGTVFWSLYPDIRTTTRQPEIPGTALTLKSLGVPLSITTLTWVTNRSDIIGGVVGTNNYNTQSVTLGNTYLPGAWVDNLTSTGGMLNNVNFVNPEPSLIPWIRAGADGSSGTVAEPEADITKFPNGNIHALLAQGESMVQAFWQSIQHPMEIACFADPLLQPHASFPVVTITSPTDGTTLSGEQQIAVSATPTGGKSLETNLDLFVDGRLVGIGSSSETVLASRTGSGFQLDTTTLSDGWHELRVVAYNNDPVRTQGEKSITFQVNNNGQSVAFSGPQAVNTAGTANFTVTPNGIPDVASLIIQSNGRTIATLPSAGGTTSVSGSLAPLGGNWLLYAIAQRANGQQIWSSPLVVPVTTTPVSALANATPGVGLANIRFFADTTGANFNWDTSTPTTVGVYNGDSGVFNVNPSPSNSKTPSTGFSPSLTWPTPPDGYTFSTHPGIEASMLYYAPTTNWYEFGNSTQTYSTIQAANIVSMTVDGQLPPSFDSVYGPVYLAAGWHTLKVRITALNSTFSWQLFARGGASNDYVQFSSQNVATIGTDATTVPVISSVTATPQTVTGTTTQLQATAALPSGNSSGLTYTWSLFSGPSPVTFSVNGTNAASSTTATFISAGNYVFLVQVTGAGGSAYAQTNTVKVQQTPSPYIGIIASPDVAGGTFDDVYAYNSDQFGNTVPITPTVAGMPTIQWSTNAVGAKIAIQSTGPNGDSARITFPNSSSAQDYTLTATGINGRPGIAQWGIYVSASNPLQVNGPPYVTINPSTKEAQVSISYVDSNDPYLSYANVQWSFTSQPPGSSATFSSSGSANTTTSPLSPGSYTAQVTITDANGTASTSSITFGVNSSGTLISLPSFTSSSTGLNAIYTTIGDTITLSPAVSTGSDPNTTYQWQISLDNGVTWQNVPGQTSGTLTLGPLAMSQNNKQYQLVVTNLAGTVTEPNGYLLNVQALSGNGGVLALDSANTLVTFPDPSYLETTQVSEGAGTLNLVVHRRGSTVGAVSVSYQIVPGSAVLGTSYLGVGGGSQVTGTLNWADGDATDKTIAIPIVNNPSITVDKVFNVALYNPSSTATIDPYTDYMEVIVCANKDNLGTLSFSPTSYSVYKNGGGSITLNVKRTASNIGTLTAIYTTQDGTALSALDYTAQTGTLSWANGDSSTKQITIPITQSTVNTGAKQFSVFLIGGNVSQNGNQATVNILDLPYEQWVRQWWANLLPSQQPIYSSFVQAIQNSSPFVYFSLNESSGSTAAGVNGSGATVVTGSYAKTGTGSFTLGQAGPQAPQFPGFTASNTGVTFTASGAGQTQSNIGSGGQPMFTNGASLNVGTLNGFSSNLNTGFSVSAWVKTTTNNQVMALMGTSNQNGWSTFQIFLNENVLGQLAPDNICLFIRADNYVDTLLDSIPLSGLPTGRLTDGNWHQITIVVPYVFSEPNGTYATFYFDGSPVSSVMEAGGDGLLYTDTFANFNQGLRIGASAESNGVEDSYFNGSMDEVTFYTSPLTSGEIANIYQAAPPTADPSQSAPNADANGDGVSNLLAYALGLNPFTSAQQSLPTGQIQNNYLTLNFPWQSSNTDITYHVQASSDLQNWTEVWNSTGYSPGSNSTSGVLSIPDTIPISSADRRFMRLEITQP